jgi:3-phosphoshikimate 1-carboxyvinyltransferase
MEASIKINKYNGPKDIAVSVPGSKSITNRALLLAALSAERCTLQGVLLSDDSRVMLECLEALGFALEIDEKKAQVTLSGSAGEIPFRRASINVGSAGTAARFLTVALALAGGEYEIQSSEQMKRRPMAELIVALRSLGVVIECLEEEGHFPLRISSDFSGSLLQPVIAVETGKSSQFASALLVGGVVCRQGLTGELQGERTKSPYIAMTVKMLRDFGVPVREAGQTIVVEGMKAFGISEYQIEPDLSSACYFYAMAPLLGSDVLVRGVLADSLQGDLRFLEVLERMGCLREETAEGIRICGSALEGFAGVEVDMQDFSDQVMTLAAIAPFAQTPTTIKNVAHIRYQESDRLKAIVTELKRVGVECEMIDKETGVIIQPILLNDDLTVDFTGDFAIETYDDHRMAMAFTLMGLKTGRVIIKNPACCAKTFAEYFEVIAGLSAPAS